MPGSVQSLPPTYYNSMSAALDSLAEELNSTGRTALADRAEHVSRECQWAATYIRHGGIYETLSFEGQIIAGITALKRAAHAAGIRLRIRDDGSTEGMTGAQAANAEHKARVKKSRKTAQSVMAEWLTSNPGALDGLGMNRGAPRG